MMHSSAHEGHAESRHASYKRMKSLFYPLFILIWPFAASVILNHTLRDGRFPSHAHANTEGNVALESIEFQDMILLKLDEMQIELKDAIMYSFDLNKKVIHLEQTLAQYKSSMNDIVESKVAAYLEAQRFPFPSTLSLETLDEQGDTKISRDTLSNITSPLKRRRESKATVQDEVSMPTSLKNRSLQQVNAQPDQTNEEFVVTIPDTSPKKIMDICKTGTILSPINRKNSFQFDEKIRDILTIASSISSPDDLLHVETPQYKATCWLIFQQVDEIIVDASLIQTYIIIVFFFSTDLLREDSPIGLTEALPDRVCLQSSIQCNNESHIIGLDFGKCMHIPLSFHLFACGFCKLTYQSS